jgi:hypothetical protein
MSNQSWNGCSARNGTLDLAPFAEPKPDMRQPPQTYRLVKAPAGLAQVGSEDLIREILQPDR